MNPNTSSNGGNTKVSTFSIGNARKLKTGRKSINSNQYANKTSRNEQKPRVQGSNGISGRVLENAFEIVSTLGKNNPDKKLVRVILTPSNLSKKDYIKLHSNLTKLNEKIVNRCNRRYPTSRFEFPQYVIVYELSTQRSYTTNLPHYDINILLVAPLEGTETWVKDLISDICFAAKEIVGNQVLKPDEQYWQCISMYEGGFRTFSGYFCKETDQALLTRFFYSDARKYLPKQWLICPPKLRKAANAAIEKGNASIRLQELHHEIEDELKNEICNKEENKNGAYYLIDHDKCNASEISNRLNSRLPQPLQEEDSIDSE